MDDDRDLLLMRQLAEGDEEVTASLARQRQRSVLAVPSCVPGAAENRQVEGVTVSFEQTDGGIVVTRSVDTPHCR